MNPIALFKSLTTVGIQTVGGFRALSAFMAARQGQVRLSLIAALAMTALALVILYIRTLGLSRALRKFKERCVIIDKHDRKKMRGMKLKSAGVTLLLMLVPLAVGFVLIRFVFPGTSGDSLPFARGVYDRLADVAIRRKLYLKVLRVLTLPAFVLWIWLISRRVRSKGGRVFWTLAVLACLGIFGRGVFLGVRSPNRADEAAVQPSADEMFVLANRCFDKKDYATAEELYSTLYARGEYTSVTDADMLNNLALAQLWQAKNREALSTMLRVFETGNAGGRHVINLLAAAEANGISSGAILRQTGAVDLLGSWIVGDNRPGEYVKLRNAIAYNIAYMDMELDESSLSDGSPYGVLFPDNSISKAITAGWASKAERDEAISESLLKMQSDNSNAYGKKDGDIQELIRYFEALTAGEKSDPGET